MPFHATFLYLELAVEPIVCVTQEDELSWNFRLIQFRNNLNLEILSEDFSAP